MSTYYRLYRFAEFGPLLHSMKLLVKKKSLSKGDLYTGLMCSFYRNNTWRNIFTNCASDGMRRFSHDNISFAMFGDFKTSINITVTPRAGCGKIYCLSLEFFHSWTSNTLSTQRVRHRSVQYTLPSLHTFSLQEGKVGMCVLTRGFGFTLSLQGYCKEKLDKLC